MFLAVQWIKHNSFRLYHLIKSQINRKNNFIHPHYGCRMSRSYNFLISTNRISRLVPTFALIGIIGTSLYISDSISTFSIAAASSILFATITCGRVSNSALNLPNSKRSESKCFHGSSHEQSMMNRRAAHRSTCFRNCMPKPRFRCEPDMRPGKSAIFTCS